MEAGRSWVSSSPQFPLKTHLRHCSSSSSSSVLVVHEQVTPALTSLSTTSLAWNPPVASLLTEEHPNDNKSLSCSKEVDSFQKTLDRRQVVMGPDALSHAGNNSDDTDEFVTGFRHKLLQRPELSYLCPPLQRKGRSLSTASESISRKTKSLTDLEADRVVALAREAFSASKEAASFARDTELFEAHFDDSSSIISDPVQKTVRSTRLLQRQSKTRRVPKPKIESHETNHRKKQQESRRKINQGIDPNDPLRLFLLGPETTQLLTANEEAELIENIQELMKLDGVKTRLQTQFSHEPTLVEWAEAVGISCQELQSRVQCGNKSRDRLIYANFRMVVHIAKPYQGRGLSLPDLLQEGSMGLMRSIKKFKPQAGCRFSSYAYWWIRQSIRKSIFQHSRTIRLPENVYALLSKVHEAKRMCFQQGNHYPRKDDIAACAGMTVERLERLLHTARLPLSVQQPVWMDQTTTHQEITADTSIEIPEVGVLKQLMRQHARNLLSMLNPRERKIIRLRFGIEDGSPKLLSEIGACFGLSKERVRQLESRALHKLRQSLSSQGLEAYADMLM